MMIWDVQGSGERPCSILASCIAGLEAGGEIVPNPASQTAQLVQAMRGC